MMDMIPSIGLDRYLEAVAWMRQGSATSQLSLIEAVAIGGLGGLALLFLFYGLVRRSAVAIVGFSFLALTALVIAQIFGRLSFVSDGARMLILCLFSCAVLLFATTTIRSARENPLVGLVILLMIAASFFAGVAGFFSFVRGEEIAALSLSATVLVMGVLIVVEFLRRDMGTIAVAPGLLAAMGALPAIAIAGREPATMTVLTAMLPVFLLSGGVGFSALVALWVVKPTAATTDQAPQKQREVGPSPFEPAAEPVLAELSSEGSYAERREAAERLGRAPRPGGRAEPEEEAPVAAPPRARRGSYDEAPMEPVSALWGRGEGPFDPEDRRPVRALDIAPDSYVWDQFAAREVRIGQDFASAFLVDAGRLATPDVLRDGVDADSLDAFDDHVLGGADPVTGPFDIDILSRHGDAFRLHGRRVTDHEGLLTRIEAHLAAAGPDHRLAAPPQDQQLAARGGREAPEDLRAGRRGPTGYPSFAPRSTKATSTPSAEKALAPRPMQRAARKAEAGDETDPLAALEAGAIGPWFQPIVSLDDRRVVGLEALARWTLPNGEVREANGFIDAILAADRGLDLVRRMVDEAAQTLRDWIEREGSAGQFVAVNLAAEDLAKDDVARIVKKAVADYALPDGALVMELSEGQVKATPSKALAAAKAIRRAGASLAIDDFGVGYSTLSRLSKFRFDIIKLDKSLLEGLSGPRNRRARQALQSILATARKSGAPVVAEGIEDDDTAELLRELGCEFGQGFLFGEAAPAGTRQASPPPSAGAPRGRRPSGPVPQATPLVQERRPPVLHPPRRQDEDKAGGGGLTSRRAPRIDPPSRDAPDRRDQASPSDDRPAPRRRVADLR
ncbi:sensory box/GGDEF domain/EAL domain protein [Parvularcula bermudensis HTCC2503]|uniref:Sensory box/GGDEF domain/EAL domain protein n=1 Tax=Parvularcula bermudensis (strain ATCC BAA-594 / HTCC2503 / KCTC 12087) TaxID=314260 RepID=E0TI69_PARBH|nr:EAL domain-containing protein [Parvularcula bermudensis]ADM09408.1 sensory box/GGDEF domain/EAL domain protein [Parvularcula bermudensis HTCC2503]